MKKSICNVQLQGQDFVVCIAICWTGGPGIESLWRRDFPQPFRPALGPIRPVQWVPSFFPGGMAWRAKLKSRAVPVLFLWDFMAYSKVNFASFNV